MIKFMKIHFSTQPILVVKVFQEWQRTFWKISSKRVEYQLKQFTKIKYTVRLTKYSAFVILNLFCVCVCMRWIKIIAPPNRKNERRYVRYNVFYFWCKYTYNASEIRSNKNDLMKMSSIDTQRKNLCVEIFSKS